MGFYPGAELHLVPSFGYPRGVHGQLLANGPRGAFFHDAVGWRHGAFQVFNDPRNRASAHIIINLDGPPWQFIDFDDAAWHAGGRIPAGHEGVGALANLFYWGFEYEGGYPTPTPITDYQIDVTIDLCKWLTQVYSFTWPAERRVDLWEHREVRNTLCPSDRIRWPVIINSLRGAPIMDGNTWKAHKLALVDDHQAEDAAFWQWAATYPGNQHQKDDTQRQIIEDARYRAFLVKRHLFDERQTSWRAPL